MQWLKSLFASALGLALVSGGFLFSTFSTDAGATAAFARSTGAKCNKCHTASFPRLTQRGERFMLNGFQLRKESSGDGFGLDDDQPEQDKYPVGLKKLSELLSVTGDFQALHLANTESYPEIGKANSAGILVTGNITENVPIWVGVDFSNGGAEIHRYTIAKTRLGDSTLLNLRMGTIDPTTWTSFYGHSGALDTPSGDIGAYGAGHHGEGSGFTAVGPGYSANNGIEYYGYTRRLTWSAGLSNGATEDHHATATTTLTCTGTTELTCTSEAADEHGSSNYDKPDYWAMGRLNIGRSSVSALWYNANGAVESQIMTIAGNLRWNDLDLRGQFSIDASKHTDAHNDTGATAHSHESTNRAYGFTLQADYALSKDVAGIYRYDTTDTGEAGGIESQATLALVVKPQQNIKVTAAYVMELDAVDAAHGHGDTTTTDSHSSGFGDHATVTVRYMF